MFKCHFVPSTQEYQTWQDLDPCYVCFIMSHFGMVLHPGSYISVTYTLNWSKYCFSVQENVIPNVMFCLWIFCFSKLCYHGLGEAYGWGEGVYRVLVGKPEGRRPLGRPRRRWVDNINMYLQEVGCGYMDWMGLAQGRDNWRTLVSALMNLRVPWNAGNFLTSCKTVSFSGRTLHHGVSKWATRQKSSVSLCGKIDKILGQSVAN